MDGENSSHPLNRGDPEKHHYSFSNHLHFQPFGVVIFSNKFVSTAAELPGGLPTVAPSAILDILPRFVVSIWKGGATALSRNHGGATAAENSAAHFPVAAAVRSGRGVAADAVSAAEVDEQQAAIEATIDERSSARRCVGEAAPPDSEAIEPENPVTDGEDITDEDLNELKGCIELGFGFNEEEGHSLCNTLPALDLYFAVSRQISSSPVSTPQSRHSVSSLGARSSSFDSPKSDSDSWKICSPGDDPQQVKTKLRHWAQAVACAVMQSL